MKLRNISDSVSSRVSRAIRKAASARLSAFTLAELIVVITILAVLATVGLLALSGYREDARDAAVKANVRSVYSAIMAESSARQESPRCFVVHDPAYALSGGVVVFDAGLADSLSG
jgi:prepilin-type N-terminal cleavage/methylation domain-containing protein